MEAIVRKLVAAFEGGQLSRRDLVKRLTATALALGGAGTARPLAASADSSSKLDSFSTVALDHISFSVSDYGRSRDFYSDLMGWEVLDDDGERSAELAMGDIGRIIIRNSRTPFTGTPTAVVDHIAWQIADWDADAVAAELARRGIENLGRDRGLGPGVPVDPDSEEGRRGYDSYIFVDPDGWRVQVSK
jgi:catechol 2,3-dioxygenase-like lactoylglutathione lyase family enzyme